MYPQQPYGREGQPGYPPQGQQGFAPQPGFAPPPSHPQGYAPRPAYGNPGYPQQQQGFSGQHGGFVPSHPGQTIDVTYVCDENTARRLTRGRALITWRLPSKWGVLLALPAFLLARGTIATMSNGGDANIGEMLGAFLVVLAFELVVVALITGVQLARVNPAFLAIAGPGQRMSARYTTDAMELHQSSGQVTNRYVDIKRVIVSGDVVYLQPRGTSGFFVPREIVPAEALARLRAARR